MNFLLKRKILNKHKKNDIRKKHSWKINRNKIKRKYKNEINPKKIFAIFIFTFFYFFSISYPHINISLESIKYPTDDITIVTALYRIPTPRHRFTEYFDWLDNFLQINRSIVFFLQKNLSEIVKSKRPKIYENKTIWIENEFSDLYFYKYKKEFEKTCKYDGYKFGASHTVPLFIIWNEKLKFLEKAINANYFKSNYFFWIDAGFFRDKNDISQYINDWPSIKRCEEDPRVILNEIRKISKEEYEKLAAFDENAHNRFKTDFHIAGNAYGGRADYLIKFIYYYYEIFKLFIEKKKFIGLDQNLYAFLSYLHPDIAKRVYSGDYGFLKSYYLEKS